MDGYKRAVSCAVCAVLCCSACCMWCVAVLTWLSLSPPENIFVVDGGSVRGWSCGGLCADCLVFESLS